MSVIQKILLQNEIYFLRIIKIFIYTHIYIRGSFNVKSKIFYITYKELKVLDHNVNLHNLSSKTASCCYDILSLKDKYRI